MASEVSKRLRLILGLIDLGDLDLVEAQLLRLEKETAENDQLPPIVEALLLFMSRVECHVGFPVLRGGRFSYGTSAFGRRVERRSRFFMSYLFGDIVACFG